MSAQFTGAAPGEWSECGGLDSAKAPNKISGAKAGDVGWRFVDGGPPLRSVLPLGINTRMSKLPPDTIAMRREIWVALIAFVLGFVVVLASLSWLIVRFVTPEARWCDVLHTSINAILISVVFGGLGFAALSVWAISRYHYRHGFYRCRFCDRPLKGVAIFCDCPGAKALRK
ncbi:MAG TPA: hypothetical protein VLT36_13520 [Candidatus Dormibacteraeota bacterium]|nr:hypothetical protein [Candidatus Dormibacteraeota bacterium]